MKKFESIENNIISSYYVGTAREVASLYKDFLSREIATPEFCSYPKFDMDKNYVLDTTNVSSDELPTMKVITSDTFVSLLLSDEEMKEVEFSC